jgi:hypothetical protein
LGFKGRYQAHSNGNVVRNGFKGDGYNQDIALAAPTAQEAVEYAVLLTDVHAL